MAEAEAEAGAPCPAPGPEAAPAAAAAAPVSRRRRLLRRAGRVLVRGLVWSARLVLALLVLAALWVLAYRFVNPPSTPYMLAEAARLGAVRQDWRSLGEMSPWMPRAAAAAEDANFCLHTGFDMAAIRAALSDTRRLRGASTISQQVAKNVFLWQGRTWTRKALEAGFTVLIELLWPKRRIIEVYLNVAEMDEGLFGVGAAAPHYFKREAKDLTLRQAALLAALLPAPKRWSAARPTAYLQRRAGQVADGAQTILADGRARCFEVAR